MSKADAQDALSKVPAVTLGFWLIKILATTLGETAGDTVSMTMNLGYLAGTAIFAGVLIVLVIAQVRAQRFHPFLYWATIIASTTAGTTLADFATRSLGIGYTGGSAILLACGPGVAGGLEADAGFDVIGPDRHAEGGAVLLADHHPVADAGHGSRRLDRGHGRAWLSRARRWCSGGCWPWSPGWRCGPGINRVVLFWAAFILTRPLGAVVGDFLDKPLDHGGLAFSRPLASAALMVVLVVLVLVIPQRPGRHPGETPLSSAA